MSGIVTLDRAPLVVVRDKWIPDELSHRLKSYTPKSQLGEIIRQCFRYLPPELAGELLDRISRTVVLESALSLVLISPEGKREDFGVVSRKVVTTAGVGYLVDAWQNSVEMENMKYHGIGTGNTAEDAGDTALVTELTTEYNPNGTRATGSTTEGASANIFRSVGTNTPDSAVAIVEHGLFSSATGGAGVLWNRSVFSVVNVGSGSSLQSQYDLTASAGG